MSFKQLLKKGTLGDLRGTSASDRDSQSSEPARAVDPSPSVRPTKVLYITGDARESRIVSGAFSHTHPHLEFDLSVELANARGHLTATPRHDVLVVGWSVQPEDAFALIHHSRDHGCPLPIVAAAEQSLDLYRQAGADECVRKGGSFLARLPIAVEDALKKRPAPPPVVKTFSPGVGALRVAYSGDLPRLQAALEGQTPPLECVSLAETLKDADLQQGNAAPFDVVLVEHGERSGAAIADVRARNLEVPVVLLVDSGDERAAYDTFGTSLDDYVPKTTEWPTRLQLRLTAARTRYQQTRELSSLRLKEARLRSLVEKLPACIVRLSTDGQVLATNERALSLLGASNANQLLRKSFDMLVDADGRTAWTDFVVRVCAGETRSAEVSLTALDGVGRILEATAVPAPVEFGRSPSMLMVLRDVTDRKRLEAAVEHATDVVAGGHDIASAHVPEHDVELHQTLEPPHTEVSRDEQRQDTRSRRDLEGELHRISGAARATFQELGTLLRDAESRHETALAKQAEEYTRLKAIETEHWQFYDAFIQGAAHGVFRATADGRLLDVNPALASMLGYESPEAVLGAGGFIGDVVAESSWTDALAHWRQQSAGPIDTSWLNQDRHVVTLRLHGRVIEGPRGEGECVEVIAENVTARRGLETQLRRARRWEDVARTTSSLAADLSHVISSVQNVNDLEMIQQATAKAAALSRQLVAFGRRGARDVAALDLNDLVNDLQNVLRRFMDEHIELTFDCALTGRVLAARPQVEEALVNLTVEAVEVLPAGGRIHVATSKVVVGAGGAAREDGIEPGEYGAIVLTASGWGIDVGVRERLLAARHEAATRGYASAARAIGQTGGGLRVESVGGESVTFTLYVPLVERADVAVEK